MNKEKLNNKQRFGFRKLSIGLAAVTLGTTLFLCDGQLVHADETPAAGQTEIQNHAVANKENDPKGTSTPTNWQYQIQFRSRCFRFSCYNSGIIWIYN